MLHEGELAADEDLVRGLLVAQAPDLAGLAVLRLDGLGTANHVFRVGDCAVVRLPRTAAMAEDLPKETAVLARVRGRLPLQTPQVLVVGRPDRSWPLGWLVERWLPGAAVTPSEDDAVDGTRAEALASAVLALHALDAEGLPPAGRQPLAELDAITREAAAATTELDRDALLSAWDRALEAPPWDGERVAIHADLLPGNLLEQDGRLSAVIDWAMAGAGDPAHDLVAAWATLRATGRSRFRTLIGADDGTWERARGIALHQALLSIPYYRTAHPRFSAMNVGTAAEVLADV